MSLPGVIEGIHIEPLRILVHGEGGSGKTTFASEFPRPIILPVETGVGELSVARFPRIKTYKEFLYRLDMLRNGDHDHKTGVIDTGDRLEKLMQIHIAEEEGSENFSEVNAAFRKGDGIALSTWTHLTNELDLIREERGMNIIILCHSEIRTHSDPTLGVSEYDTYKLDLSPKIGKLIYDWCDMVLFLNWETITKKDADKNIKGIDTGVRYLHTTRKPSHLAKNRYSFPEKIEYVKGEGFNAIDQLMSKYF